MPQQQPNAGIIAPAKDGSSILLLSDYTPFRLVLLPGCFEERIWAFFLQVTGYLLIASLIILRSPLYLQRPIAMGFYALVLLGDRYLLSPNRWTGMVCAFVDVEAIN